MYILYPRTDITFLGKNEDGMKEFMDAYFSTEWKEIWNESCEGIKSWSIYHKYHEREDMLADPTSIDSNLYFTYFNWGKQNIFPLLTSVSRHLINEEESYTVLGPDPSCIKRKAISRCYNVPTVMTRRVSSFMRVHRGTRFLYIGLRYQYRAY